MSAIKINSVKNYVGKKVDKPSKLSYGDTFYSEDTEELWVYGEDGTPTEIKSNSPTFDKLTLNAKSKITPMSGTITTNFPSTAINNTSGTAFTSEIEVGDGLLVNGVVYEVTNVVNDSFLFVSPSIPAISNASISKVSVSPPLIINNVDGDEIFSVNGEGDVDFSGDVIIDGELRVNDNTYLNGSLSAGSGSLYGTINFSGIIGSSATGTTQTAGDNSTKVATTEYVDTAVPDNVLFGDITNDYILRKNSSGDIVNSIIYDNGSGIDINGEGGVNTFLSISKDSNTKSYISINLDGQDNGETFFVGANGFAGLVIPRINTGSLYHTANATNPNSRFKIFSESNSDEIAAELSSLNIKDDIRKEISGSVTTDGSTDAVVGSGTLFTTELKSGDRVRFKDDNDVYVVDVITDDTNLTLTSIPDSFTSIDLLVEASDLLSATNYDGVEKFAVTQDGLKLPKFTTTEINAIASPTSGLMVYNTTLNSICFYNGTIWHVVTSGDMNAV